SPTYLGFTGFASQIPVFLLAPIGGAIADRMDRKRIMIFTQAASLVLALLLGILTLAGQITTWEVLALAAALGIVNAFAIPAQQGFVVDVVSRDDLINAITLNSSLVNGAW